MKIFIYLCIVKLNIYKMMEQAFIGRQEEVARLKKYAQSNQAEFVAVYGRRRVGKTYLINHVFHGQLAFSMTGIIGGKRVAQLQVFVDAMDIYGNPVEQPDNWQEAFRLLRHYLMDRLADDRPCVVFIDELPCFDTRKSDFLEALGHFWNSWASLQPQMMLIVCGSATSWMMENVIDTHGGLHNRITHEIHLKEFTLREEEEYLTARGFHWDRDMVLQTYMVMGGIPYYLSLLDTDLSLAQNIDKLFFDPDGEMYREFDRLYRTLFSTPEPYIAIIEALFSKKKGLTRTEIAQAIGVDANGRLTRMLRNLVDCDLVRFYPVKEKRLSTRNGLYQLVDFFSLFYFQFMQGVNNDSQYWTKNMHTPKIATWRGLTFERVCMTHIQQIKHALGIDGISTTFYSWRATDEQDRDAELGNAQIDIVIDRADNMANVCEAKYSETPYAIDKEEYNKFLNRMQRFQQSTNHKGGLIPTFITSAGLARNSYAERLGAKAIDLDHLIK